MDELTIEVAPRSATGKNESRRLRAGGEIPGVVYGGGRDPVNVAVDRHTMLELMRKAGTENAIYLLKLVGTEKSRHVMIREMDLHPVTRQVRHIDFQRILLTEKVRVSVPVHLQGTPEGVKNEGGLLDFITREIEIESLPADIPRYFDLDVSALHIGQHVEVRQVPLPDGVTLVSPPERVIASVAHAKVAVEAEAEEGEELLIEAEAVEPEVIGRRREEPEEGEEAG
jgi:large subunit ribosomal protein L25